MTTIDLPEVYAAQSDTWLLGGVLDEVLDAAPTGVRVLELGTGSGALAVRAAARAGTAVTAVDVSHDALAYAGLAARDQGVSLRLLHGDLTAPVAGETFDLVLSNPPYVPCAQAEVPLDGPTRAWDAGHDGRAVLDRLCREVPRVLAPGGTVLIVHSELSDVGVTRRLLAGQGLVVEEAARCEVPFGPVLSGRIDYLESAGLLEPGRRTETLVVLRARA